MRRSETEPRACIVRDGDGRFYGIRINCPGCEQGAHVLPVYWLPEGATESPQVQCMPHWTFNGDFAKPTLLPSIRSRSHGWRSVCHSFVRDGRIQYLGDCTHTLAGQTVELPPIDTPESAPRGAGETNEHE